MTASDVARGGISGGGIACERSREASTWKPLQQERCQEKLRNKVRGCGARKAKPSKRGDCSEGRTRQKKQNTVKGEAEKEMTRKRRGISPGFALG